MKAIVIGATGATGSELVKLLAASEAFSEIEIFVRREIKPLNAKVKVNVIDFDRPEEWRALVKGDVLFSALGTSLKQAGSKDRQWQIDYDYQLEFAKAAEENGVPVYVLISSMMADRAAGSFYLRMKGELDAKIKELSFESAIIMRPSVLVREQKRLGEKISLAFLKLLNALGLFTKYRPIRTRELAQAMIKLALRRPSGYTIVDRDEIFQYV